MKALTLTQPWATLVACGAKRIETRSWSTAYRGLIAIHAAKGFPNECKRLCLEQPFLAALYPAGFVGAGSLPVGAIVAMVDLVDVVRTDAYCVPGEQRAQEYAFGNFAPGRYAWILDAVGALAEPIPCKGTLGLWTVPDDVEKSIWRPQL